MATKHGMKNVQHSDSSLGPVVAVQQVTVQVDDASRDLFFRQAVLELKDNKGERVVEIGSGTGLGGDFIAIAYTADDGTTYHGVAYMREIAREWIRQIDPKAPAALLDALTPDRS